MVRLVAYQAFEGSGVLEVDGRLLYIDFPYAKENEYPISEAQVGRLINQMGFEPSNLEFPNGPSVIEFLKAQANKGADPFAGETEDSFLEKFNSLGVRNLEAIVESIKSKYIDNQQYVRAIRGLDRIKGLEAVKASATLRLKVVELLLICHEEMEITYAFKIKSLEASSIRNRAQHAKVDDRFPNLNGNIAKKLEPAQIVSENLAA